MDTETKLTKVGVYSGSCANIACPSGRTLCSDGGANNNTCRTNMVCGAGQEWNVCDNSCSTPYVLQAPAASQSVSNDITFTGNETVNGMISTGAPALVLGAGQNGIYQVAGGTSAGSLMLLQTYNGGAYTDRFRVTAVGDTTANSFTGNGAGLTSLTGANVTGTVLNATNATNANNASGLATGTYANIYTFNNPANVLYGDGANITGIATSGLAAGTYANIYTFNNPANILYGNGANLTNLNASNLSSGTVPVAQLGTGASATKFLRGDNTWQPVVSSAIAGSGIGLSGAIGAVTFSNTGVTSLTAGTNISLSGSTGAVTINCPSCGGGATPTLQQVTTAGATTNVATGFGGQTVNGNYGISVKNPTATVGGAGIFGMASNSGTYGVLGNSTVAGGYGGYFSATAGTPLYVSGAATVSGVLTVGSCVGCGGLSGGVANYLARWTGASAQTTSIIQDNGTNIGVGVSPTYKLDVSGTGRFSSYIGVNGAVPAANKGIFVNAPASGYGIWASAATPGIAVYGSTGGTGVGVEGYTTGTGPAVYGYTAGGGKGVEGYGTYGIYSTGTTYSFYGAGGTLYNSGNVGLGSLPSSYKLDVNGDIAIKGQRVLYYSAGAISIGSGSNPAGDISFDSGGSTNAKVYGNGNLAFRTRYAGGFISNACLASVSGLYVFNDCVSLAKYKENIETLPIGLETVRKLRPVVFEWKDNHRTDLGFIAEEVEKINPLLSQYDQDGKLTSVKYMQMSALLVNAVKEIDLTINGFVAEVHQTNKAQDSEIQALKAQVRSLDQRLLKLEAK